MKPTTFTWGWKQYPQQADPKQTRQHMARLMRSWRRAKTNTGQILNKVSLVKRSTNRREYQVINTPTGEMATFTIQVATQ